MDTQLPRLALGMKFTPCAYREIDELRLMSEPPLKLFSTSSDASDSSAPRSSEIEDTRRERELDRIAGNAKAKTMPVAFGAFMKFLSQAIEEDCAWLDDFADDTIHIDADLHEVIVAYHQMGRQRAA